MKAVTFKNRMNNEQFLCDDVRTVQHIDGVEYLLVHKIAQDRKFLMRKDALEKVNTAVVQRRGQHSSKV